MKLLRSRWVIPCHDGTFPALTGTPELLRQELEKQGVEAEVIAPKPGETVR
jgi:L-ascorbate metabolism protein UlaG (beta-lactamase superfamily)